jgi:hypothetical protein
MSKIFFRFEGRPTLGEAGLEFTLNEKIWRLLKDCTKNVKGGRSASPKCKVTTKFVGESDKSVREPPAPKRRFPFLYRTSFPNEVSFRPFTADCADFADKRRNNLNRPRYPRPSAVMFKLRNLELLQHVSELKDSGVPRVLTAHQYPRPASSAGARLLIPSLWFPSPTLS